MKNEILNLGKLYLIFLTTLNWASVSFGFEKINSLILGDVKSKLNYKIVNYSEKDVKTYIDFTKNGEDLKNNCSWINRPKYITEQIKNTNLMNYLASFQYAALNSIAKNMANLAFQNELNVEEFKILSNNLVNNFCSENLSIISKKELENNLNFYFSIVKLPQADNILGPHNKTLSNLLNKKEYFSNQLKNAINSFRSICSWGGTPTDLGLLLPFVKNEYVMASIFEKISNATRDFPTVVCESLICRPKDLDEKMRVEFVSEMKSFFCHYFDKFPKRPVTENATLKSWSDATTDDDFNSQISQVIASLNHQPNILAMSDGQNNSQIYMSNFDDFFSNWSNQKLSFFSNNLLFEEKITLRPSNLVQTKSNRQLNFEVDFGEIDQSKNSVGKITTFFDFKLDGKLINYIQREIEFPINWSSKKEKLLNKVIREHLSEVSTKIYHDYFSYINEDYFYELISSQIYQDIFNNNLMMDKNFNGLYRIKFHFGHFALSYIRSLKRTIN